MGRILIGVISALACFMLVETLTCNQCSFGLLGFCLSSSSVECTTNTSQCFTGKATFVSISSSVGFNTQGCIEEAACNMTTNATLLGVTYQATVECCSTDGCNPAQMSGAPSARMTLPGAIGAAALASVWGSLL
ncbi:sperm acrosome membrane-associated protein 4-like isoform X2 [Phyllopteryx taeniolatus]|uniref:sperm acrosome membrane-associated protein 4-like isoform X2 n=1 Tax=Phyllopteryx taeniolatus TaxID=161469 RepID=UPI002AD3FDE0|nr:sperm acrosome membrane-associated protein 4-like isoform X2 [Phyllopteryx taeniolatus]